MRLSTKIATAFAALCVAAPVAIANPGDSFRPADVPPDYGATNHPGYDGTDNPRLSREEARALGRKECQEFKANFSENKSQFGRCIADVARSLRTDASPREACQGQNRKPEEGERRSDFSACVAAAARAQREQS